MIKHVEETRINTVYICDICYRETLSPENDCRWNSKWGECYICDKNLCGKHVFRTDFPNIRGDSFEFCESCYNAHVIQYNEEFMKNLYEPDVYLYHLESSELSRWLDFELRFLNHVTRLKIEHLENKKREQESEN